MGPTEEDLIIVERIHEYAEIITKLTDFDEIQAYIYEIDYIICDYLDETAYPPLRLIKDKDESS